MSDITPTRSWPRVSFGEVVKLTRERSSDPVGDGFDRYIGLEHIDPGDLKIRRWGSTSDGTTFTSVFRRGQVLFGKRRAYQRKIAVADFDGVCSGDIYAFECKGANLLPELLPFVCQTDEFFDHAIGTSAGSLSPRTNWDSLSTFQFPLPPLEEQRNIAAACMMARNVCERYDDLSGSAASLLRAFLAAFEEDVADTCVSIGSLVEGHLLHDPQDGNHGEIHPKASDYVAVGVPFLMAADIRDGEVDLEGCHYLPDPVASKLRTGFAHDGDILLTHKGTLGQTAVLRNLSTDYAMLTPQVTFYRVLDTTKLLSEYLYYMFQSDRFQRQMSTLGRQSTRAYVGITKQRELRVPFPSVALQETAVKRCAAIAGAVRLARIRSNEAAQMGQAIMRKALVTSEPA